MEKSNKIYMIVIFVCAALVIGLCGYAIITHKDEKISDAIKFKNEYEALNELVNENSDEKYVNVEISEKNPIVYKTGKEILEVLKNEDAIIYFGFAACPWCRNAVPVLLDIANEMNVEKIYYVDILNIRDTYKFSGSIEPELTKKGTDAYYEIVKFLDKYLKKFYVNDDAGNMYDTGVKRLYAPTVVGVKNGKVVGFHEATVESQTDPYEVLTDKQKEELKKEYKTIIEAVNKKDNVCKDNTAC
ncbi:MAG: hypothetical protein U0M92_01740 [Bacilli bacterium]